jgi:hypothetical protein
MVVGAPGGRVAAEGIGPEQGVGEAIAGARGPRASTPGGEVARSGRLAVSRFVLEWQPGDYQRRGHGARTL